MKFHKALSLAREIAEDSEYCVYMRLPHKAYELEVDGQSFRPVWVEDREPIRKRSFECEDFLSTQWEVIYE